MAIDLSVELFNIRFNNPVMPAAGPPVRDAKTALLAKEGGAAAIVTKTISTKGAKVPRPCITGVKNGLLNSELWSEKEPEKWFELEYPEIKKLDIPLVIGLGYSGDEIKKLAPQAAEYADLLELSTHYLGDDTSPVIEAVKAAKEVVDIPVLVKLSPQVDIEKFAKVAQEAGADGIVLINSFGPCLDIDIETGGAKLGNTNGYGWLSGKAIFPLALRCVFEACQSVDLPVIAVGGISTGEDAVKMIMAGAEAVQVCTAAMLEGPKVYQKIADEIKDFMVENGYNSLAEFRGLAQDKLVAEKKFKKLVPGLESGCIKCGICEMRCPYQAIELKDELVIDENKCFGCGLCISLCPKDALAFSEESE